MKVKYVTNVFWGTQHQRVLDSLSSYVAPYVKGGIVASCEFIVPNTDLW